MIRKAISCDICGAQRREANHWFIAYEQSGELRVSDWTSGYLLCPGTKHLCGESCLHKLLSEFLARAAQMPTLQTAASPAPRAAVSSVHISLPAEPRASRHLHTEFNSTSSRSSQHADRALDALRHSCAGKRTS